MKKEQKNPIRKIVLAGLVATLVLVAVVGLTTPKETAPDYPAEGYDTDEKTRETLSDETISTVFLVMSGLTLVIIAATLIRAFKQ